VRLAYLTNRSGYPRHGFIADEIAALQSAGARVTRFALHATQDRHGRDRHVIDVIRSRHVARLLLIMLSTLWDRPALFLVALRATIRIARHADRRPWARFMRLVEACAFLRETQSNRIDHVHVHGGAEAATVALLCRALGGPPFSFAPHGPAEFERPHAVALEEKIRHAAFVVADGAFARSQLLRWCGHGQWEKIHFVRPMLHLNRSHAATFNTRRDTPLPSFVCVGRLCEAKGQRLLVEAAAVLATERLPFEILIYGDGPLRNELEALARLRGLSGRVRFLGTPRHHDLQERMAVARAVVVPSLSEGLPHPAMGAFALGRPVIACNVAGVGELVESGTNGWLVEPGSVTAIADAMREAIRATPERLAQLGAAGRERLARNHNPDVETPKLLQFFAQSVAAAHGRLARSTRQAHVVATCPPRVTVIIVNWNRGDDVAFNLRHLARLRYPNLEILVVDNGSTDGSVDRFANVPGVHLIKLPHNHGPSRARNVGIQAATGKYVVFLDSDAVLAKRALHALVARMESDPGIGIAGCKILNWHTRKIDQWIYAEPYETHGNTSFESYSFSAAGAIARAEALRDVGGFWERLFIYNEEVDLSIRMLRGGHRIVFAPDARVFHRPAINGRAGSGDYFRLQIRNWIWIYFRYYPRLVCWWKVTSYSAIYLLKGLVNRELTPAVRGIFDGLRERSIIREYADDKLSYEQVGLIDSLNRRTAIRLRR
jgi:GT2 family glycosyltransferase/glycosyltransferase involved in cell wall biosynthesis